MEFRYYISNKWTKDEIVHVMEALDFAASYFKLTTGVTTVKLLATESGEYGTADKIKNNRFELRVKKDSNIDNVFRTIFHEMCHINQYVNKGLSLSGKMAKFEGKEHSKDDYWFSPWELEARSLEEALLYHFKLEYY